MLFYTLARSPATAKRVSRLARAPPVTAAEPPLRMPSRAVRAPRRTTRTGGEEAQPCHKDPAGVPPKPRGIAAQARRTARILSVSYADHVQLLRKTCPHRDHNRYIPHSQSCTKRSPAASAGACCILQRRLEDNSYPLSCRSSLTSILDSGRVDVSGVSAFRTSSLRNPARPLPLRPRAVLS
jgi:hypothetical protein